MKNNTQKNSKSTAGNNKQENNLNKKVRYKSLVIDNEKYRTTYTRKFENRKNWIKPDEKKIISFIPCTIIKVFVNEGQEVKKNDEMLVLEAMKMQNTLYFPASGIIRKVHVKAGDKIPKGFLIVEYN
jgi:biotin carboxyl carrier protein